MVCVCRGTGGGVRASEEREGNGVERETEEETVRKERENQRACVEVTAREVIAQRAGESGRERESARESETESGGT